MELYKDGDKQLEDRTAHLGSKNMELVHQLRRLENQIKDIQQSDGEKVRAIMLCSCCLLLFVLVV